jgi:hypothetical protein
MIKKKSEEELEFYINEIGVLNWLKDSGEPRKIRFQNRWEYRVNNKLHREDGPAIEFFDNIGDQYYLNGEKKTAEEYQNFRRTKLIDEMTK